MTGIKEAIFPMAGLGTRLFPMTKTSPKELLTLMNKPLLHYAVEEALNSGIEKFIFIIRKEKGPHQTYFQKLKGLVSSQNIHYVYQETPLGLGHAIACAKDYIKNEFFAVLLPDEFISSQTPCLQQMLEVHAVKQANILAVQTVLQEEIPQYGIVDVEKTPLSSILKLKDLVEKPSLEKAPTSLAIIGRYILSSRVFSYLERQQPGAKGEIQLTDSLRALLKEEPLYCLEFEGQRFDCGSKKGYLTATLRLSSEKQEVK